MIETTLNTEKETKEITYPCIMKCTDGLVVGFIKESEGVVLKEIDKYSMKLFEYRKDWLMEAFTPLNEEESITLKNIF